MTFTIPKCTKENALKLFVFSDSYFGLDQEYVIDLDTINLRIIKKYNLSKEVYYQQMYNSTKDYPKEEKMLSKVEEADENIESEESDCPYEDDDDFLQDII